MKTLISLFLLAAAISYAGLAWLELLPTPQWVSDLFSDDTNAFFSGGMGESGSKTYPAKIQVTDLKGRSLDILLTARTNQEFVFERIEDGRVFKFPLRELTPESKELVESFPAAESLGMEQADNKKASFEETYLVGLREAIKRTEAKAKAVRYEAARTESDAKLRSLRNEYKELWKKYVDLKEELDQREAALASTESNQN